MVSEIIITADTHRSCLYHAHLTQSEEVAGYLLGHDEDDKVIIYASVINPRKTKEKDRVEIDPISSAQATELAD